MRIVFALRIWPLRVIPHLAAAILSQNWGCSGPETCFGSHFFPSVESQGLNLIYRRSYIYFGHKFAMGTSSSKNIIHLNKDLLLNVKIPHMHVRNFVSTLSTLKLACPFLIPDSFILLTKKHYTIHLPRVYPTGVIRENGMIGLAVVNVLSMCKFIWTMQIQFSKVSHSNPVF